MTVQNVQLVNIKKRLFDQFEDGTLIETNDVGEFSLQRRNRRMEGLDSLVQLVITHLFFDNSSVMTPGLGSKLPSLVGKNITSSGEIEILVSAAIEKVRDDILETQETNDSNLPDSALLSDIMVKDVVINDELTKVEISIIVYSVDGTSVDLTNNINIL